MTAWFVGAVVAAVSVVVVSLILLCRAERQGADRCNLVRLQRARLARRFARAGLVESERVLGQDRIRYWTGGTGPTVVFLHGFGGDALWQWVEQINAFIGSHRLVVPNLLWFGGSSSQDRDASIEHQTRAINALLGELGVDSFDLVGLSYGGLVAWEIAARHPRRVRRLVLVDSSGPLFTSADLDGLKRRFDLQHPADLLVPAEARRVRQLIELAYHRPPWTPAWALDMAQRALYREHREELRALLEALLDQIGDDQNGRAHAIDPVCPTLVVWGRGDPVFPLPIAERVVERLGSSARLEVIDDARHGPNMEHPRQFNAIVSGFLDEDATSSREGA